MSVARLNLLVLIAITALAVFVFAAARSSEPSSTDGGRRSPLASVPATATWVVSVDLIAARESALPRALLGGGRELPGLGRLQEICGFDPSEHVHHVVVASGTRRGDADSALGLAAFGHFSSAAIVECAEQVMRRRGGEPRRNTVGRFTWVSDGRRPDAELAVAPGGPVLLGEARYLQEMIASWEGRSPSWADAPARRALAAELGAEGVLFASVHPEPGWLERVSGMPDASASPLAAIRRGALHIDAELSTLTLWADCSGREACAELAQFTREVSAPALLVLSESLGFQPLSTPVITAAEQRVRVTAGIRDGTALHLVRWASRYVGQTP